MTAILIMYPLKSFAIIDQGRARHYGGKIPTVDKRTLSTAVSDLLLVFIY